MKTLLLIIALCSSMGCIAHDANIYPTVFKDFITVDFGDSLEHIVNIYSIDGKLVYSKITKNCQLSLDLKPAMYIILIDNEYSYKIICQ